MPPGRVCRRGGPGSRSRALAAVPSLFRRRHASFLLALGCLTGALATAGAEIPGSVTYSGMCDASAGVALDGDLFAVANDEDNVLRVYSRTEPGRPRAVVNVSKFLRLARGSRETDLEGAARVGDRVYWITSHGRNASGKAAPNRRRFFATAIRSQGPLTSLEPVGRPCVTLLEALAADPRLAPLDLLAAAERPPKEAGALNIEGLCVGPAGGLLIGFRNPVPGGKALLVPLLNPGEVVGGARVRLGDPILLDLGGLGIRDLFYADGRMILIAGPQESGENLRLFEWRPGAAAPRGIGAVDLRGATPEALVAFPGAPATGVLVLSDDGTRRVGGTECKKLKDPEQRRFRAWFLNL